MPLDSCLSGIFLPYQIRDSKTDTNAQMSEDRCLRDKQDRIKQFIFSYGLDYAKDLDLCIETDLFRIVTSVTPDAIEICR